MIHNAHRTGYFHQPLGIKKLKKTMGFSTLPRSRKSSGPAASSLFSSVSPSWSTNFSAESAPKRNAKKLGANHQDSLKSSFGNVANQWVSIHICCCAYLHLFAWSDTSPRWLARIFASTAEAHLSNFEESSPLSVPCLSKGGPPRMMEKHGLFRVLPNPTVNWQNAMFSSCSRSGDLCFYFFYFFN